jgi:UDP-2,3-diacylglucosamine hydrolase
LTPTKKIFFASDFHLGVPNHAESLEREKRIVKWLEKVKNEGSHLFLLGDVFDFWFEYKRVAPRGYVRLLGKLAELSDAGIKIEWFTGNHDMWIFDYLPKEIGFELHRNPVVREFGGKRFYLGPATKDINSLKKFFHPVFANGVSPVFIPISAFGWPIIFPEKAGWQGKGKMKNFSGKKSGWLSIAGNF